MYKDAQIHMDELPAYTYIYVCVFNTFCIYMYYHVFLLNGCLLNFKFSL